MIIEIQGDLTETDCKVISQGVNCQGVMGSGVAKALYTKWPVVKNYYHNYFIDNNAGPDGENFLGEIDPVRLTKEDKVVINCFTQQYFGGDGRLYLSYDALYTCMNQVLEYCQYNKIDELAIPKIGCGLAGGDWTKVKAILESIFPEDFKVKVYIK